MKRNLVQFIGYATMIFIFIMLVFDVIFPGFIPTYHFLTPFYATAIVALLYSVWKYKPEPVKPSENWPWKTWIAGLAVMGVLMYKAYTLFELPFWVVFVTFFLFLIISGLMILYERGYLSWGESDAPSSSDVGHK